MAARAVMRHYGVAVLHGKELNQTKADFEGWKISKKVEFLTELNDMLGKTAMFGISVGIEKAKYEDLRKKEKVNPNESAFGFCFRAAMNQILLSYEVFAAQAQGLSLSFVLEQGNKNNNDALRIYNSFRAASVHFANFGGISFADKSSTVSLQMADLLVYFTRRYTVDCRRVGRPLPEPDLLKTIVRSKTPIATLLGTSFEKGVLSPVLPDDVLEAAIRKALNSSK